jgi:glycosyltransferase involved in cell wall biosynthesis
MSFKSEAPSPALTVAICIGTYNQGQYIRGSIESALSQTYQIHEIWIADDGSNDETQSIVEQYCRDFPRVHYHRHAENMGPARNLSWVLGRPSTDLVVRLDSDDRLEPEYVEILANLMHQYPQAGYAHCDVWETDGYGNRSRLRQLTRTATYEDAEQALRSNSKGLRTAANCLLFRASALKEANYYLAHPSWTASEDWDLALRMILNGWGNVYAAKTLSNYRQWDDPKGVRAYRKIQEVSSNIEIFTQVVIPEFQKRGWSVAPIQRSMRSKAIGFADSLDSAYFNENDRAEYRVLLKQLGQSVSLNIAIFLADFGLNPLVRRWKRLKKKLRDIAKQSLRATKSSAAKA